MSSTEKLKSGTWRVRQYIGKENGKSIYKSFTGKTKKEAEAKARRYIMYEAIDQTEKISLREACEKYIASKEKILSPSTISGYRAITRNRLQSIMPKMIGSITKEDIQRAFNEDAQVCSYKTLKNTRGFLSAVFAVYRPNFAISATLPKKPRNRYYVPQKAEIDAILKHTEGTAFYLPLLIEINSGLREGELSALCYEDIEGNVIHVNKTKVKKIEDGKVSWVIKPPKSYSGDRYIAMPSSVIRAIGTGTGEIVGMNPQQIYARFKKVLKECGVNPFRFHDIRHYHCSLLHDIGFSDAVIMKRMGWSNPEVMYNIYRHVLPETEQEVSRKLDQYFG